VPYKFPMLACFVTRLLDELGYERFDVLGISWGGGLAQQLAFQNPRRCRRVVLVSTGTGMLMVPGRPAVLSKMVTSRRYRDPEYGRLLYDQERIGSRSGYLLQLLAGVGWTSLFALPLIRQPALVLAGTDDPIIPPVNARILHGLLPHATLHFYADGHLGLVTDAAELGPRVADFLRAEV
jgi:pimeloyl-ACP methyl ester carboxylesterase